MKFCGRGRIYVIGGNLMIPVVGIVFSAFTGRHRKERPHKEGGDGFGAVAGSFERSGEKPEILRDEAGDPRSAARGIERLRVGPRKAKRLAHVGVAQPGEQDAVALRIGERDVARLSQLGGG